MRNVPRSDAAEPARTVAWPTDQSIAYLIDIENSRASGELQLVVRAEPVAASQRASSGFDLDETAWLQAPDPADRELAHLLLGARQWSHLPHLHQQLRFTIPPVMFDTTLRRICETGRCRLLQRKSEPRGPILRWDDGPLWSLRLRFVAQSNREWEVAGYLMRGDEERSLREPVLLLHGLAIAADNISRLQDVVAWPLVQLLRSESPLRAGAGCAGAAAQDRADLGRGAGARTAQALR